MVEDEAFAFLHPLPVLFCCGLFFFNGFLLWKGRLLLLSGTAVLKATQLVLYCQDSMCCSS